MADRMLAGRYRLGAVLGRGGAGVVRAAEDTLLRRSVAVKEVRLPPAISDADRSVMRERVMREARAAGRVHHPGLVTVFDVIEEDGRPWIVMELLDGRSLAEVIRADGPLPPAVVARIGVSLGYALDAAHRAGIIHRDVKPGNVMIGRDGQARLTDFGIAQSEGDATLTGTGMLLGSPAYIAPERARGVAATKASDIWGLGGTLFAAAEGQAPYEGTDPISTLAAVVDGRRRDFVRSGPLTGVLRDMLATDPAQRPSLAEVRGRLREIAEAGGARGPVPPPVDEEETQLAATRRTPVPFDDPAEDEQVDDLADDEQVAHLGDEGLPDVVDGPETIVGPEPVGPEFVGPRSPGTEPAGPPSPGKLPGDTESQPRRRQARVLLLAAVVVVVAAAVALGLLLSNGSTSKAHVGLATPTATSSAPRSPSAGTSASRTPSPSPAPSTRPSPSVTPSGVPTSALAIPSTTTPVSPPPGFISYQSADGWSVSYPNGWAQSGGRGPGGVQFTGPNGSYLLVNAQPVAGPSAIGAWRANEAGVAQADADYRRITIAPADGKDGITAADWEWTYTDRGVPVHVLNRAIVRNGHGYALLWQTPQSAWFASLPTMYKAFATFRPGP